VRGLRVAELAGAVGVSPHAIRYYERAGLLAPPARTLAGYRAYDAGVVDRLRFIQGAQRLGLKLRDIADLLAIHDTGACRATRPSSCSVGGSPTWTPRRRGWLRCAPRWSR